MFLEWLLSKLKTLASLVMLIILLIVEVLVFLNISSNFSMKNLGLATALVSLIFFAISSMILRFNAKKYSTRCSLRDSMGQKKYDFLSAGNIILPPFVFLGLGIVLFFK